MGVPQVEIASGFAVVELDPRHHANVHAAPSVRSHSLRGVRKPEMLEIERFEAGFAVENRHEFVLPAGAIEIVEAPAIASQPDPIVFGMIRRDVFQLMVNPFLRADKVGSGQGEKGFDSRTTLGPGIKRHFLGVADARVAHVERHHFESHILRRRGCRRSGGRDFGCQARRASNPPTARRRRRCLWFDMVL